MKFEKRMCLALSLTLVALLGFAQTPKPKLPGEDWVSLFNGSDLSGWAKVGKESWTVEDGVIHGKGRDEGLRLSSNRKDLPGFPARAPVQMCRRREQRRILSFRIHARYRGRHARHAV